MMEPVILGIGDKLRIDTRARDWCKLKYPGHPKGCPNYGKSSRCPPQAPWIGDYFDAKRGLWLLAVPFDLGAHVRRMLGTHPDWSNRKARCVLYWQGTVNKELWLMCELFAWGHPGAVYTTCPEAMGVHVIRTARKLGLPIRPRPIDLVWKVAIAGYPR